MKLNQYLHWKLRICGEEKMGVSNQTRNATGFKSLRVNCWEINQVTPKCSDKTCKKCLKQKSEHHHWILNIWIILGTKFQQKILSRSATREATCIPSLLYYISSFALLVATWTCTKTLLKFQNIMTRIAWKLFFCSLHFQWWFNFPEKCSFSSK